MKNKKGFTLVELLVTIALMLSILAIAIVSFINISNKKKQESYDLVKEQIITAAEQYFNSNEYLFEGLVDSSYGIISVGKLVSEDYLNKVTNPVTGKLVNYCSQVEVKKENGRYKSKFIESDATSCESNNSIIVSEPGAPSISLKFYKSNDIHKNEITADTKTGWFNKAKLGDSTLSVFIEGNQNNNGKISGISICKTNGKTICTNYSDFKSGPTYDDTETFASDTTEKTACYKVTNLSGKSTSECVTAKVDTVKPTCSANIAGGIVGNNGWYKGTPAPTVTFSAADSLSGMSDNYKNDKKALPVNEGENKTYSKKYADVAGNTCTISKTVSYDGTNPTCKKNIYGTNENGDIYKNAGWYTSDVTITGECSDSNSGCTEDVSKIFNNEMAQTSVSPGTVYDKAGNSASCDTETFGIDRTAPIFNSVKRVNKSLAPGHSNHMQIDPSDNISGINKVTYRHCYVGNSEKLWYCKNTPIENRAFGNAITQPTNGYYILNLRDEVTVKFEFKLYDNAGNTRIHGPFDYALPN